MSRIDDTLKVIEESLDHVIDFNGATLTDDAYSVIEDMEDSGADQDAILDKVAEFIYDDTAEEAIGQSGIRGVAADILDDYNSEKELKKKEPTNGEIEDMYDEMMSEGFPEEEALRILSRAFGMSTREIEMIVS